MRARKKVAGKTEADTADKKNKAAQAAVEQAIDYIQNHYEQPLTREDLARLVGLSAKYMGSIFKKVTGTSISAYITEVRVRKAKEQMVSSKLKVNEIAKQVGYEDEFYFSRMFKQNVGQAPLIFIQKPKRIASLWYDYTFDLLQLGIVPELYMTDVWGQVDRYTRQLGLRNKSQYKWHESEKLDQLLYHTDVDILLVPDNKRENADHWRKRHAVVELPWVWMNWRERFLLVAEMLHKKRNAEEWLKRYDAQIDWLQRRIGSWITPKETVTIVNVRSDKLYIYGDDRMGGDILYNSLGLKPSRAVLEEVILGGQWPLIAPDEIVRYDADHLFITVDRQDRQAMERLRQLLQTPVWQGTPAMKNKRFYVLDHGRWYGYTPFCLSQQLHDIQQLWERHGAK